MRLWRNAGVLLLGKGVRGLLTLASLAVAARILGVRDFGVLVLIHGYVIVLAHLASFASWQTLLRYGAQALHRDDRERFGSIVRFTLLLDACGAAIALGLMLATAAPAIDWFGLPAERIDAIRLYGTSVALLVGGNGAFGVLSLFNRFDLLAVQDAVLPAVRLLGALVVFVAGGGLVGFLIAWYAGLVVSRAVLAALAARELARRGLRRQPRRPLRELLNPEPGIWRFAAGTNLLSTLKLAESKVGLLVVGGVLGPAAAGLYRVAQQFAEVVTQPVNKLLVPAISPEINRLTAGGDHAARSAVVVRSALIVAALALSALTALAVAGRWLIAVGVGHGYAAAYAPMVLLAVAGVLGAATFTLEPLLVSVGRVRVAVLARIGATALYLAALDVLLRRIGLIGAGAASIGYALAMAVALLWLTRGSLGANAAAAAPAGKPEAPE